MDSFHGHTAFLLLGGDVSKVKFKKEIQRNVVLEEVSLSRDPSQTRHCLKGMMEEEKYIKKLYFGVFHGHIVLRIH